MATNTAPSTLPRILVLVGNYGSGKTELALNLAFRLRGLWHPAALVDLDIVNPYFRSAERRELLEAAGIRVIAPTFALTAVDVPALPAQVQSVFDQTAERVVFDVGGDDTGAAALGQYAARLAAEGAACWFVLNGCRPFSRTPDAVADLVGRIERRARTKITGIISNTNLGDATELEAVLAGHALAEDAAARLGVPIVALTGEARLADQLPEGLRGLFRPIQRFMRPEFFDAPSAS